MARRQQMADRALRPAMRSPGWPIPARHVEREFWRLIARGKSTEDAAVTVGVSVPVGSRWFRHARGMVPRSLTETTGRYLSFPEREEGTLSGRRRMARPRWSAGNQREVREMAVLPVGPLAHVVRARTQLGPDLPRGWCPSPTANAHHGPRRGTISQSMPCRS